MGGETPTIRRRGPLSADEAARIATEYWRLGHDCAQTLVATFCDLGAIDGIDTRALQIASTGFGNGMGGMQGDCGALSGSVIVINAIFAPTMKTAQAMYPLVARFVDEFRALEGEIQCMQLRHLHREDCKSITVQAARLLAEFLNEEFAKRGLLVESDDD